MGLEFISPSRHQHPTNSRQTGQPAPEGTAPGAFLRDIPQAWVGRCRRGSLPEQSPGKLEGPLAQTCRPFVFPLRWIPRQMSFFFFLRWIPQYSFFGFFVRPEQPVQVCIFRDELFPGQHARSLGLSRSYGSLEARAFSIFILGRAPA